MDREQLVEELKNNCPMVDERDGSQRPLYDVEVHMLVDWIIEYRKIILGPLIKIYENHLEKAIRSNFSQCGCEYCEAVWIAGLHEGQEKG